MYKRQVQNCITRITNGQETVKVLAHFCCNNSISNIERDVYKRQLYECLKNESPEITVDPEVAKKAVKPIQRMLEISAKLGL